MSEFSVVLSEAEIQHIIALLESEMRDSQYVHTVEFATLLRLKLREVIE